MTHHLRRSIFSDNGSSQNIHQSIAQGYDPKTAEVADSPERQPDLALDIQALQILDSSDDCIKVLDLEGRILFMNRGGQVLLGIQDIKPFLHTSWIEFWQGADRQSAIDAIARAKAGEVCTFQGYCPTPSSEPKWWECKISPMRGVDRQVERLLCISRDITERRQIEDERKHTALNAEFLATVTQDLAEATCVEDIIQTVGERLNQYFQISICAFIEINESKEVAAIHHSWHQKEVPSLVGVYHLSEFVTGEFFQAAKLGQTIVVRDVKTDPRIVDPERLASLKIGSLINVPLIRDGEWRFMLGIYHQTPYNWRSDEVELMRELANRIWTKLERTRVEVALRQNQEMFSALVADAPFGVYAIDAEFRLQQANQTAIATFNIQPLIGRDLAEALRIIWQEPFATEAIDRFRHTLATGESYYSPPMVERRADIEEIQSYDWRLHRITLPDGSYGVVCYFYDLSEIKRAEAIVLGNADRDAFLVTLNDALRPLTDASEIQAIAARILGESLGATRVIYIEVVPDDDEVIVRCNYVNGVAQLSGRYRLEDYRRNLMADHQAGRTQVVLDIPGNPQYTDAEKAKYHEIDIAAHIDVPLIKNNQFVALLAAQQSTPRQWTEIEVNLVEETAERTWAAVERARAEANLRESEAKYRGLFESLDEGYFLADVIFDDNDQPIDILYLEANAAATRMVGQDYTGQRLREIDLYYEAYWYEIFGRVARTGIGERLEQYAEPERKWYDFYVFRVGNENSRRVSVVFKDITDRKRREAHAAFLAEIGEDFSRLSTADEIMQTVGAKIGAYLQITSCNFTDVDEARDRVTVHNGWSSPTIPSTVGTFRISHYFSQEFLQSCRAGETVMICNTQTDPRTNAAGYAALNMYSFVTVPFHRNGQWTHYIAICHSQPRDWRDDEIQLIEEISNRIFPRLERARTEQALRESEAKYRSLFESIDEGFCLIEVLFDEGGKAFDYRILEANPAFEKHTGLVDAIGKTMREFAPQMETHWFEIYGRIALTGVPERFENVAQELGRFYDVYAFRMGEAQERKVAVIFNDISNRKQVEVVLRESEERFRLMADAVPQIVWITDAEGRVEFFNKQWSNYTGVAYEPTTAAEVAANFVHPDDGALTMEAFNEARQTGNTFTVEHRIRAANGAYRWFLVKAEPYRHPVTGDIIRWFGASIDIHDRKQAEAAIAADLRDTQLLRELSARLTTENSIQALYQEIMAAAIVLTHADAGTVQILDETTQDLVLLATQSIEQKMVEYFHRVNASSDTPCGMALRSSVRSFIDFDVPASKDPDGSMRLHVEAGLLCAQSTPLISRSGKPIGMVSTHWHTRHRPSDRELRFLDLLARQAADLIEQRQDAAQRKQLLEREQAAREEAEQANRIKDEFLAVLSHELRTPLNPILGWSTLLLKGKLDATKTTLALSTIQRNAKLQSELIEDLLDVARILRGKLNLNVAEVNLAATIRGAMETVQLAAEAKSIQIEASLAEDVGLVLGDSTRLQQVAWNLLSNAVKFTPPGGQVSIRLERFDSSAKITVSDTGQGIAPDFLPFVFDYFRQADGATTRKFGGLGLGLAIVRHLVELHGGTVSVASPGLGQGATFTVRVPLMSASSEAKQDVRSRSVPLGVSPQQFLDLSGSKILVVDDEPDTRELVAFVLEQQGAQVTTATSAYEALFILPQAKPDVLLSDIGMPEMDGYMLIQQVRMLTPEQGGQLPAIALTAYAGDTNQQQVIAAGFQKHISKPIEPEVLVQAIAHLIHPNCNDSQI